MFGAELSEFVAFGRQLGLALAGASALWGAVFAYRSGCFSDETDVIDAWVADKIQIPLYGGILIAAVSWIAQLLMYDLPLYAHEGIVIRESASQVVAALHALTPLLYIWILISLIWLLLRGGMRSLCNRYLFQYYIVQFGFATVLISFPALAEGWGATQFFFFGHSFHSIMTLGTVLILDYLFLISSSRDILKQHVYPLFETLSKVIWLGLGLEFISTLNIFRDALEVTPKFLFMQIGVAIVIINGVLLSGPLLRRLLDSIKKDGSPMTDVWMRVAEVSGAVSIASWLSVTFVDFFDHLTLSFFDYLGVYLMFIALLVAVHRIWTHLQQAPRFLPPYS